MFLRVLVWVCVVCTAMTFAIGCSSDQDIDTRDLLLPIEVLPPAWELNGPARQLGPSRGFGDEDDFFVTFKLKTDKHYISEHYVLRYHTPQQAARDYTEQMGYRFNDQRLSVDEPWQTPAELSFVSGYGNQYHMACTVNNVAGPKQVCELMGQYSNFVTIFYAIIRPDTISLEEFNQVAGYIDEIMVSRLQLDE